MAPLRGRRWTRHAGILNPCRRTGGRNHGAHKPRDQSRLLRHDMRSLQPVLSLRERQLAQDCDDPAGLPRVGCVCRHLRAQPGRAPLRTRFSPANQSRPRHAGVEGRALLRELHGFRTSGVRRGSTDQTGAGAHRQHHRDAGVARRARTVTPDGVHAGIQFLRGA